MPGWALLDLRGRAGAFVGEARGHADVEDDQVGSVLGDDAGQLVGLPERGDDLVAAVLEEAREPRAQQHLILDDHDAHGSLAISVVPAPGWLSMRSVPPSAAARSPRPLRPEPATGAAPPTPSSATQRTRWPFSRPALSAIRVARACLTAFVTASQPMKYAAASTPGSKRRRRDAHVDQHRGATSELAERGGETGVELGGRQAAGELAQLLERDLDLGYRVVERVARAGPAWSQ